MTEGPDPHALLLAEIGPLLRDEGEPAVRYALARSLGVLIANKAAKAVHDLADELGSNDAAAKELGITPQAVGQLLAKHGFASPRKPGRYPARPKETDDATRT